MERELEKNRALWQLFEAIAALRTSQECALFFRDLCTFNELSAMAERWQVARHLAQGLPYRAIREKTGASTTTITRVAHWLKHGEGGYRMMLERLGEKSSAQQEKRGKEKS